VLLTWQSDLVAGWTVMVDGSISQPVSIPALAQYAATTVDVLIQIPSDILSGTLNETVITATSQLDPEVFDSALNSTVVGIDVDVSLEPDLVGWADQNYAVYYTHTLTNIGNYTDSFTLEIKSFKVRPSDPGPWLASIISPPWPVLLAKGESIDVVVGVMVPAFAQEVDVHTALITATSVADTAVFAVVTDTTIAQRRLGVGLTPDSALSGGDTFVSLQAFEPPAHATLEVRPGDGPVLQKPETPSS